jgi:hypothetical protein
MSRPSHPACMDLAASPNKRLFSGEVYSPLDGANERKACSRRAADRSSAQTIYTIGRFDRRCRYGLPSPAPAPSRSSLVDQHADMFFGQGRAGGHGFEQVLGREPQKARAATCNTRTRGPQRAGNLDQVEAASQRLWDPPAEPPDAAAAAKARTRRLGHDVSVDHHCGPWVWSSLHTPVDNVTKSL